jgi:hypothetical protein
MVEGCVACECMVHVEILCLHGGARDILLCAGISFFYRIGYYEYARMHRGKM